MFQRFLIPLGLFGILSACLPGMSPSGTPSNPAGVANSENSRSAEGDASGESVDHPSDGVIQSPAGPTSVATGEPPPPIEIAKGGTFSPKGDGESVGGDQQKDATDWRLGFGVNAWWELSRTAPDTYPVFKNSTTDFKMKLEFQSRDSGQWVLAGPTPNGNPVVSMVYQPKGQAAQTAQTFAVGDAFPEGHNVAFLNLNVGEGTVTFSVEYLGITHPLGSFTTYYSDVDPSTTVAPAFQSK